MGKLKLTVNEEKTRICKVPEGEFDFLGYTFGRMYSAKTGQARIGYRPSKKSIQRAVVTIRALTDQSGTWQETTKLVGKMNRTLRGSGELLLGRRLQQGVSGARAPTRRCGCARWLRTKHKVKRRRGGSYPTRGPLRALRELVRLSRLGRDDPWTKA